MQRDRAVLQMRRDPSSLQVAMCCPSQRAAAPVMAPTWNSPRRRACRVTRHHTYFCYFNHICYFSPWHGNFPAHEPVYYNPDWMQLHGAVK